MFEPIACPITVAESTQISRNIENDYVGLQLKKIRQAG